MKKLASLFWLPLGRWLETRNIDAVAETCYRFAADDQGKRGVTALLLLGKKSLFRGAIQDGLQIFQLAVQRDPQNADAWCALGAAFRHAAQLDDARGCYDRALNFNPTHLHALTNIGELLLVQKQPQLALDYFKRVLEREPKFYEAIGNKISALIACGRLDEAEAAVKKALVHFPESAGLHVNHGSVLMTKGEYRLAFQATRQALEIEPHHREALVNLALLQGDTALLKDSVPFIKSKIDMEGESFHSLMLLSYALAADEQFAESEVIARQLIEQYPTHAAGWLILGSCVAAKGESAEAIQYYWKAIEFAPQSTETFSNILFDSNNLAELSSEEVFERHLQYAERFEFPEVKKQFQHALPDSPKEKIKVGYLSGDLRRHPVGNLLQGVIQQHDRERFEIHCFCTNSNKDDLTEIFRVHSDAWHDVQFLSFEELAYLINENNIDILVDLAGHTAYNRLRAFTRKPAPVQVSWIGYFHSTGLKSMDYFITDPYTTPCNGQQLFSETPVYLPNTRFCFTPPEFSPEVARPPFEQAGYITFGSFNRLSKLSDLVIKTWSRLVMGVPNAKLLIKAREFADAVVLEQVRQRFASNGLAAERLILRPASGHLQMLREYADVDIALDPFPFNGGMTTFEALWMGVPIVALSGNTVVSRQSTSILMNMRLKELIFPDIESYISGAIELAQDNPRMAYLRNNIRLLMQKSQLCDPVQFTKDLESLYQRMLLAWSKGEKISN